jgi:hypothetical protein
MENMAGVVKCGPTIKKELKIAGIIKLRRVSLKKRQKDEVPVPVMGLLTKDGKIAFKFRRAWYYWVVEGDVPLNIAQILYGTNVGKKDVRVAGHCGCPPPEEWAFPKGDVLIEKGIIKLPSKEHPYGEGPTYGELAKMCNKGEIQAPRFVDHYHIDSQEGLNFFVKTIKEHSLAS